MVSANQFEQGYWDALNSLVRIDPGILRRALSTERILAPITRGLRMSEPRFFRFSELQGTGRVYFSRATRKPKVAPGKFGSEECKRLAERRPTSVSPKFPPRITRTTPVGGL